MCVKDSDFCPMTMNFDLTLVFFFFREEIEVRERGYEEKSKNDELCGCGRIIEGERGIWRRGVAGTKDDPAIAERGEKRGDERGLYLTD